MGEILELNSVEEVQQPIPKVFGAMSQLDLPYRGRVYQNTSIIWFVADRMQFPAPLEDLFDDVSEVAGNERALNFARQFLSFDELSQFDDWLQKHGGPRLSAWAAQTPFPANRIGFRDLKYVRSVEGILQMQALTEWELPFAVHGYFSTMPRNVLSHRTVHNLFNSTTEIKP